MVEALGIAATCLELARVGIDLYQVVQRFVDARPKLKKVVDEIRRSSRLLSRLNEVFQDEDSEESICQDGTLAQARSTLDDYREVFDELQVAVNKVLRGKNKDDVTRPISKWTVPRWLLKEPQIEYLTARLDRCMSDADRMLNILIYVRIKKSDHQKPVATPVYSVPRVGIKSVPSGTAFGVASASSTNDLILQGVDLDTVLSLDRAAFYLSRDITTARDVLTETGRCSCIPIQDTYQAMLEASKRCAYLCNISTSRMDSSAVAIIRQTAEKIAANIDKNEARAQMTSLEQLQSSLMASGCLVSVLQKDGESLLDTRDHVPRQETGRIVPVASGSDSGSGPDLCAVEIYGPQRSRTNVEDSVPSPSDEDGSPRRRTIRRPAERSHTSLSEADLPDLDQLRAHYRDPYWRNRVLQSGLIISPEDFADIAVEGIYKYKQEEREERLARERRDAEMLEELYEGGDVRERGERENLERGENDMLSERQRAVMAQPVSHEPNWIGLEQRDVPRRGARTESHGESRRTRAMRAKEDEEEEDDDDQQERAAWFSRRGRPFAEYDAATLIARWTK